MFSCGAACGGSDPTADTVKVDPALLAAAGKENAQPTNSAPEKAYEAQKAVEEQRRREAELKAVEERQKSQEKAKKMREEQDEATRRHDQEEEQKRQAAYLDKRKSEAAAAAKAKEAEQVGLGKARAAEERVRADQEAAEKAAKEEADRKIAVQVAAWCKKNGFKDMNTEKKGFMSGSKFPLHVAVTNKDAAMVGLMVQLGVDKTVKNSKGQTGTDLATKLNKDGSMATILASLI